MKKAPVCPCESDPFAYDCHVVNERLAFNVVVPQLKSFHGAFDDRKVTLIGEQVPKRGSQGPIKNFGSSTCIGTIKGTKCSVFKYFKS